jgi:hypothetical protein
VVNAANQERTSDTPYGATGDILSFSIIGLGIFHHTMTSDRNKTNAAMGSSMSEEERKARVAVAGKVGAIWNLNSPTDAIPENIRRGRYLWQWYDRALLHQIHGIAQRIPGDEGLKKFQAVLRAVYAERIQARPDKKGFKRKILTLSVFQFLSIRRQRRERVSRRLEQLAKLSRVWFPD